MNDEQVRALCDWYLTCDRATFPNPPFSLTGWQMVTGERFFDTLTREVMDEIDYLNGDRTSPPVRLRGLLKDLEALKTLSFTQIDDYDDW
ncbi:hypothetical protein H6F51_24715 [Cyanobacteria bacterium FACHB-DQ100]|nr:hypothetical protein [Cyanobacteria bacterium FACHB-DQ100]